MDHWGKSQNAPAQGRVNITELQMVNSYNIFRIWVLGFEWRLYALPVGIWGHLRRARAYSQTSASGWGLINKWNCYFFFFFFFNFVYLPFIGRNRFSLSPSSVVHIGHGIRIYNKQENSLNKPSHDWDLLFGKICPSQSATTIYIQVSKVNINTFCPWNYIRTWTCVPMCIHIRTNVKSQASPLGWGLINIKNIDL